MSATAKEIFDNVIKALQDAEEMGGPEGEDYLALMRAISNEALARAENYRDVI